MKGSVSVRDRVAELVAEHGSYARAAAVLGTLSGTLHMMGTGAKLPRRDLLVKIGLDPDSGKFNRLQS